MTDISIEYIILFVAFVLPGAISMYVYGFLVPQTEGRLQDRVVEAISFSLVNFVLLFWPIQFLLNPSFIQNHTFWAWMIVLACFVLAPIFWPCILVTILGFLARQRLIIVQTKTAWDGFFKDLRSGCWVIITLNDGTKVGGRFGKESTASTYPDPGHIYIEDLWEVLENDTFGQRLPGNPGIILRPTDYRFVKVFKELNHVKST